MKDENSYTSFSLYIPHLNNDLYARIHVKKTVVMSHNHNDANITQFFINIIQENSKYKDAIEQINHPATKITPTHSFSVFLRNPYHKVMNIAVLNKDPMEDAIEMTY